MGGRKEVDKMGAIVSAIALFGLIVAMASTGDVVDTKWHKPLESTPWVTTASAAEPAIPVTDAGDHASRSKTYANALEFVRDTQSAADIWFYDSSLNPTEIPHGEYVCDLSKQRQAVRDYWLNPDDDIAAGPVKRTACWTENRVVRSDWRPGMNVGAGQFKVEPVRWVKICEGDTCRLVPIQQSQIQAYSESCADGSCSTMNQPVQRGWGFFRRR